MPRNRICVTESGPDLLFFLNSGLKYVACQFEFESPLRGHKIGFSPALMQGRASNLMKWTLDEMDLTIHLSSLEYFAELVGAI